MSQVDDHVIAPNAPSSVFGSDALVERVLRWAVVEQGTAGLSDDLGAATGKR